jgi:hypothetical protein
MMIFNRNDPNKAQTLTYELGGDWRGTNGLAPCPVCQPERRNDQRALSLRTDEATLLLFCHKSGCSFRDIFNALGMMPGDAVTDQIAANTATAARADYEAQQLSKARQLWARSHSIIGTKGHAYLKERGISCDLPSTLRWAPDTYHAPSARRLSAIVADVSTGGVHRTFIEKSGARVKKNAKMMQGLCAGGAVEITQMSGPLVVAEGIETALSLASGLLRAPATVWAALSTSGFVNLLLPNIPSRLTIATDGDDAGRKAGYALAERATALGWHVALLPAPDGQDWNDVLRQTGGAV